MPVNTKHDSYGRMIERWERCRDAADGQDAIHARGEKYLPKLKDQTPTEYDAYKGRAVFYNATWRTIAGLLGMLFRKPPHVEVAKSVEPLLDDVTMSGVPFHLFVQDVCEEALKVGRLGVLVDFPQVDAKNLTQADAKQQNLRPLMATYRAESIINWRYGQVNNATVLTMVVLKECEMVPKDEFEQKAEDRWRVLDIAGGKYRVRVFKMEGDKQVQIGGDVFPMMASKNLDYIPFTFVSTDDNTAEIDEPPLIDLVNLNLSHYRSSADFEHGAHFTGLPTPWIAGFTPTMDAQGKPTQQLYIGSTSAWIFSDPDAKAAFLEFSGEGLGALERSMEAKEKLMAIIGARMLEQQKKAPETVESQQNQRKGEESMLAASSQSISISITRALKWFSEWAGADAEAVEFELNRDFYATPMSPQMLTALVTSWQQGAFSDETLFTKLQQGEIVAHDRTLEEEQAAIEESGPKLTGQPMDPATGRPIPPGQLPPKQKPAPAPAPKKK